MVVECTIKWQIIMAVIIIGSTRKYDGNISKYSITNITTDYTNMS